MNTTRRLLASAVLMAASTSPVLAQDWTLTSAPPLDWRCIVSSADGQRLTAGARAGGYIYTSTNSAATWAPNSALDGANAVACSADGSILVAEVDEGSYGRLCVSTNSGANWKSVFSPSHHWWTSVACSADGQRMAAVSGYGPWFTNGVYLSTNSGADWVLSGAVVEYPSSVVSSANGSRLAVAAWGAVHVSTDWGATWRPTYPTNQDMWYRSLAASATGATLLAAGSSTGVNSPGLIWISGDWGATWKPAGTLTNDLHWLSAACSADGLTLAVLESSFSHGTRALLSTNSGAGWWATTLDARTNICSVVLSADGSKVAAALGQFWPGTGIYVRETAPAPRLEILPLSGRLQLSWVVPSSNFVLQESLDLAAWSGVQTTPVLNFTNLHHEVSLPVSTGARFYRLASQ